MKRFVFSSTSFSLDDAQLEEDNRDILRLLRESSPTDKLDGLKRLIAQSAPPLSRHTSVRCSRSALQ
jgi:hypothetical protein